MTRHGLFSLGPHDVHVWALRLDLPQGLHERLASVVSDAEAARARRFVAEVDRLRSVAARALLRVVLSGYVGVRPELVPLETGEGGKPRIAGCGGPRFSLTHAGSRGLVAVSAAREVGVDLERIGDLGDLEALARAGCTRAEREALRSLPAVERTRGFLAVWTRKEAYLKAQGVGLTAAPQACEVPPVDGVAGPGGIAVRGLPAAPGHVAALAIEAGPVTVRRRSWRALQRLVEGGLAGGRGPADGRVSPRRGRGAPRERRGGSGSRPLVGEGAS